MRVLLLAVLALPLLAAKSDPLAGRVAGPMKRCITLSAQQGGPVIADNNTILYRENGWRTWRAEVIGQCTTMQTFDTLIVDVWGGQLCRNDRFRVLRAGTGIPGPFCRFGGFTPFEKVKKP